MSHPPILPNSIRIRMHPRLLNIPPNLPLPPKIAPKPSIPLLHLLYKTRHLLLSRKARHQLRFPQRQLIAPVNLPQMIHFSVQMDDFLHFFVFGDFPGGFGDGGGFGHDEHAGFNFEDVGVPEFLFGGVEGLEEAGGDHVLWCVLALKYSRRRGPVRRARVRHEAEVGLEAIMEDEENAMREKKKRATYQSQ